ncbi:hypothetical protein KL932_003412 [Ogataea haglerorum]|nr:hypothetical protein KL932_003412 [Ogataea haglerorum]KAG7768505.1 hypothetical protein KL931_003111 [Ogataea haglerorum]
MYVRSKCPGMVGYIEGFIAAVFSLILGIVQTVIPQRKKPTQPFLESSINVKETLFPPSFQLFKNLTTKDLKPCSTTDSQYVSFKNGSGEVKFQLVDKHQHQLSPLSENDSPVMRSMETIAKTDEFIALSPVSSVKSSNSNSSSLRESSASDSSSDVDQANTDSPKFYKCQECDAKFKIKGYLTRHLKKHSTKKAYTCPFYDGNSSQRCHVNGGFSRRDTFKTHLKARHFKYPKGVRSGDRTGVSGWCMACGEEFLNNEIWVERHLELGLCPGLSSEYLDRLKLGRKKTGKHSKLLDVAAQTHTKTPIPMMNSPTSLTSTPSPQISGPFTQGPRYSAATAVAPPITAYGSFQIAPPVQNRYVASQSSPSVADDDDDYISLDSENSPYVFRSQPQPMWTSSYTPNHPFAFTGYAM